MSPVNRTERPPSGPMRPYLFPAVAEDHLPNGLEIRTAIKTELPLVTAMVVLDAGEAAAAPRPGLAVLSGDAIEGGTRSRSGKALAEALESMGATFGTATGWDSTTVAISCMAERTPEALALLSEMVREPAYEPGELERFTRQHLATIAQRAMNPATLASDEFARFLYADGSTYGRPLDGTRATVEGTGSGDCLTFAGARYTPASSGLVLVGDLEEAEAETWIEDAFGGWEGEAAGPAPVVAEPRDRERRIHVVHRPGAVQSEIRVGHVGVARDTEDYSAIEVFNLTLGGSFTSRLNLNLRERHGFTYGVRSRFLTRRGPGPFLVSTAVETGVTGAAVREIHREIETMAESGPDEDELRSARSYLAGVFPLKLESTGQIAARVAELLVYDLASDYHARYRDRIRAVTLDHSRAAARAWLHPEALCTLIVGDAEAVVGSLRAEGFNDVTIHGTNP